MTEEEDDIGDFNRALYNRVFDGIFARFVIFLLMMAFFWGVNNKFPEIPIVVAIAFVLFVWPAADLVVRALFRRITKNN